jgi:hypothetical protein
MSRVEFQGVSKSYPIYDSPGDRLKDLITPRRYQFHRRPASAHPQPTF